MGDSHQSLLRPLFHGSLAIEGRGDRLTPLAGTVLLRELDERLGATAALAHFNLLTTSTPVSEKIGKARHALVVFEREPRRWLGGRDGGGSRREDGEGILESQESRHGHGVPESAHGRSRTRKFVGG